MLFCGARHCRHSSRHLALAHSVKQRVHHPPTFALLEIWFNPCNRHGARQKWPCLLPRAVCFFTRLSRVVKETAISLFPTLVPSKVQKRSEPLRLAKTRKYITRAFTWCGAWSRLELGQHLSELSPVSCQAPTLRYSLHLPRQRQRREGDPRKQRRYSSAAVIVAELF